MPEPVIERVADDDAENLELVRELFREYHEWLGEVVCSVRLAEEIASLPGPYAAPCGALYLARIADADAAVGCIGVRPHHGSACEIKRLYVRAQARGTGLGGTLIRIAIETARELGYAEALVTTLPDTMPVAAAMYERLGFCETEPFLDMSYVDGSVRMTYLRLEL
jgi:GNAT superfamily N-acetyltransferase